METAKTLSHKGYIIEIAYDSDPESPREWDNLGIMACWHGRGNYGDIQPKYSSTDYMIQVMNEKQQRDNLYENIPLEKVQRMFERDNLVIPIMAYEHGGITIRAYDYGNFPDQQWDCGQLGFIHVSKDEIKQEYGNAGKKNMEKARKCLLGEIETYNDYLTGQVYGFIVKDENDKEIDSCWGFYGLDYCIQEAKNSVEWEVKNRQEKQYTGQLYLTGMEV